MVIYTHAAADTTQWNRVLSLPGWRKEDILSSSSFFLHSSLCSWIAISFIHAKGWKKERELKKRGLVEEFFLPFFLCRRGIRIVSWLGSIHSVSFLPSSFFSLQTSLIRPVSSSFCTLSSPSRSISCSWSKFSLNYSNDSEFELSGERHHVGC